MRGAGAGPIQENRTFRKVKGVDFFALLYLAIATSLDPKIEWNHAEKSLGQWLQDQLEKSFWMRTEAVEDALYCAHLASENGTYYHPHGRPFDTVVKALTRQGEYFDIDLHIFRPKQEC